MSYDAMPVAIRKVRGVQVLASATAAQFIPCLAPGWNVVTRSEAKAIASFCESNGQADRRNTWAPGERIALQGLGRQIRHRLNKKGAKS